MTRARATADTQDNNGGSVPPFVAGKNRIINGDFGIWQRGTSFTIGANGYTADQWYYDLTSAIPSGTISRQTFTPGTAPAAPYESQYFFRTNITANNGCPIFLHGQKIEDVRTLAGQTVTVSFWAKADAATTFSVGLDQAFGSGGSSVVTTSVGTPSLTTSWQRFTYTISLPSLSGKTIGTNSFLYLKFIFPNSGSFVRNGTYDIWGVQLEAGSVATPFTTATGNPASELAACQRYYYPIARANAQDGCMPVARIATTYAEATFYLPVPMRTAPSLDNVAVGGVLGRFVAYDTSFNVTVVNVTSIGISANYGNQAISLGFTSGSLTYSQGAASCHFDNANVASTLAFTAEL